MTVQYLPILINFLLGGFAVAGTNSSWKLLASNPLAGAIFWSYPITIIPSVFFMRQSGKDNKYIAKFLFSDFCVRIARDCDNGNELFYKGSDKDVFIMGAYRQSFLWST